MPRISALSGLTFTGLNDSCVSGINPFLRRNDGFSTIAIRSVIRMRNRSLFANDHS